MKADSVIRQPGFYGSPEAKIVIKSNRNNNSDYSKVNQQSLKEKLSHIFSKNKGLGKPSKITSKDAPSRFVD